MDSRSPLPRGQAAQMTGWGILTPGVRGDKLRGNDNKSRLLDLVCYRLLVLLNVIPLILFTFALSNLTFFICALFNLL
jgi:hypothetical protein